MYEHADQALFEEYQERLSLIAFPRAIRPGVLSFIEHASHNGEPEDEIRQKVDKFIESRDYGDLWPDDPEAVGFIADELGGMSKATVLVFAIMLYAVLPLSVVAAITFWAVR